MIKMSPDSPTKHSTHAIGSATPDLQCVRCVTHAFLLVLPSVVAVYLKDSWWSIEDVLRTSDPTREGLMKVRACDVK